jgi:pilus assembly protein CpaB
MLAGGAALYTHKVLRAPQPQPALVQVVVAKADVGFGQPVLPEHAELRPWPADAVPPEAFTSLRGVVGDGKGEPRRARRAIAAGEVLLAAKLSGFGEKVKITGLIDPALRAVAIRVNDVTGVAGFVTPADRVDIILTRRQEDGLRATTILQDVQVLGIDQIADADRDRPSVVRTITVQVPPADVQKLALAQQAGTLSLSLRHFASVEQTVLRPISDGELGSDKPPGGQPAPAAPTVLVNRGGARSQVQVPRS